MHVHALQQVQCVFQTHAFYIRYHLPRDSLPAENRPAAWFGSIETGPLILSGRVGIAHLQRMLDGLYVSRKTGIIEFRAVLPGIRKTDRTRSRTHQPVG